MLISVVIPNYNHGHYISNNINGLLEQSYQNWEVIIVDDGSTDNSKEIIEAFAKKDNRIKPIFLEKNQGAIFAINVGVEQASGELCYSSGADDYICNKDFFQKTVGMLTQYPNAAGVAFKTTTIDAHTDQPLYTEGMNFTGYLSGLESISSFFLETLMIPGGGNIFRTKLMKEFKHQEELGPLTDYYMINALPLYGGICFVNEVGMLFRYSPNSYGFSRGSDDTYFSRLAHMESRLINLCNQFSINISADLRRFWRNARMEWRFHPIRANVSDQDYLSLKNEAGVILNNIAGALETSSHESLKASSHFHNRSELPPVNHQLFNQSHYHASFTEIASISLLDTLALANLWSLAVASNPMGAMAEIGTFKGGSALHLANACPGRKLYVFDPFLDVPYESLDPHLDAHIQPDLFCGAAIDAVSNLFTGKNVEIHQGYFPQSCFDKTFNKFSFVHLDVGSYYATVQSLKVLLQYNILFPKSYLLINNYNCNSLGIQKALKEIKYQFFNIQIIPLSSNQCLIITE